MSFRMAMNRPLARGRIASDKPTKMTDHSIADSQLGMVLKATKTSISGTKI